MNRNPEDIWDKGRKNFDETTYNIFKQESFNTNERMLINGIDLYNEFGAHIEHDMFPWPDYEYDEGGFYGGYGQEVFYAEAQNIEFTVRIIVDLKQPINKKYKNFEQFFDSLEYVFYGKPDGIKYAGDNYVYIALSKYPTKKFYGYLRSINKDKQRTYIRQNSKIAVIETNWVVFPYFWQYTGKTDAEFKKFIDYYNTYDVREFREISTKKLIGVNKWRENEWPR